MSKKILVKDWMDREIEIGREEYVAKFIDSIAPAMAPLGWEFFEEVEEIKARVAELAGKNFDRIAEVDALFGMEVR